MLSSVIINNILYFPAVVIITHTHARTRTRIDHRRTHARFRYAKYLNDVLGHFELDVREQTDVLDITPALKEGEQVQIKTNKGDFSCHFVVWAGGEFHYPKKIP